MIQAEIVLHVIKQCFQGCYHHWNRFSMKLMVSAGVSWNGKTLIFFIHPQKTKVNQKINDFLKTSLLPECRRLYPDNDFVFMQISAPSHRDKVTQSFLWDNTPDFIVCVYARRSMFAVVSWLTSVWTHPSVMVTQPAWTCCGRARRWSLSQVCSTLTSLLLPAW